MVKIPLIIIFFVLAIVFLIGLIRSQQTQHNPLQQKFLKGKVPAQLPDGLLNGSVSVETNWLGKKFDATEKTGINLFQENDTTVEKYPFVVTTGKGLTDKDLDVIKIDYNIPTNPLWLRFVLDEIVEIAPNHYLGKLHLTIMPGISFALGYFELKQ